MIEYGPYLGEKHVDRNQACRVISADDALAKSFGGYAVVKIEEVLDKSLVRSKRGYLRRVDFKIPVRGQSIEMLEKHQIKNSKIYPVVNTVHGPFPIIEGQIDYLVITIDNTVYGITEDIYKRKFIRFGDTEILKFKLLGHDLTVIVHGPFHEQDLNLVTAELKKRLS